jgi:exopolysaccharide biosynthesis polyprenyl glycosylphosphotransferase
MGRFNKGASTNLIHIASDCVFGVIALFTALLISNNLSLKPIQITYSATCVTFMIIFILANKESRVYNVTTFFYTDRIIRYVSRSFIIASGVSSTLLFNVGNADEVRDFYIVFLISVYILMLVSAFLVRFVTKRLGVFAPRTLFLGNIEKFSKFEKYLNKSNMDVKVIGYVSIQKENNQEAYLGSVDELESIIHNNGIDQVYIMHHNNDEFDIQPFVKMCIEMGVTARIIMNSYRAAVAQTYVSSVGTYPVVTYHTVTLNNSSRALKRVIDIIGSLVGILLSLPFMILTALAVKIDSKGPAIFKQERVGMNGRHFNMFKFRSMCIDAEEKKKELLDQNEIEGGLMFKIKDDPRVTKVGKFIRKTSLDELPQFFNVLKGDMSLVGTRPPTLDEVKGYERIHWRRLSIKPGITGMWQVSGRSAISDFYEIVQLDTEYIDKWNVLLDLRILAKTVLKVFGRKGAY